METLARVIFVVFLQNVETSLYSDVSTFWSKYYQKKKKAWVKNVETSLYSEFPHFEEILHK